jgi:BRCA1-associated RING domain protein 1
MAGVPVSTSWSPSVTHVIASTDQSGACKRTLKFLMAILNGKWIVSIDCKFAVLPNGTFSYLW